MSIANGLTFIPASGMAVAPDWGSTRALPSLAPHLPVRSPSRPDQARQDDAALSEVLEDARTALREAAKAAADAAARARVLAEGLDAVLTELTARDMAPAARPNALRETLPQNLALSRREREVLALVAEGQTNKAIADALFVSPNTVKTHVTSLLHKFHVETRVQLAAIATRQTLLPVSAVEPISL